MIRLELVLCVLTAFIFAIGCSVRDPEDERQLELILKGQPTSVIGPIARATANRNAIRWLSGRYRFDVVVQTKCLDQNDKSGIVTPLHIPDAVPPIRVIEMLACLTHGGLTYMECLIEGAVMRSADAEKIIRISQFGTNPLCLSEEADGYELENLPDDCDPKKVTSSDEARWLLESPVPPVGLDLAAPGELVPFLLRLCPLDVGWGCPDDAHYAGPGGEHQ